MATTSAPIQFVAGSALKIVIILLTIVVLVLLDPSYVTAYISVKNFFFKFFKFIFLDKL